MTICYKKKLFLIALLPIIFVTYRKTLERPLMGLRYLFIFFSFISSSNAIPSQYPLLTHIRVHTHTHTHAVGMRKTESVRFTSNAKSMLKCVCYTVPFFVHFVVCLCQKMWKNKFWIIWENVGCVDIRHIKMILLCFKCSTIERNTVVKSTPDRWTLRFQFSLSFSFALSRSRALHIAAIQTTDA